MAEPGALALLASGADQAATLLCVTLYLGLSWGIARLLRQPGVKGVAFGLLVVAGGANLALFTLRAAVQPIALFLPVAAVLTLAIAGVLRRWVLPRAVPPAAASDAEWMLLAGVLAAFWAVRIIQVDPSTGLSSQLGWTPLYLRSSFDAGRFLLPGDFRFGVGPAEFLFYSVDLLGLAALPGALGLERFYPAYLAGSIVSTGLALAVLLSALRGRVAAQLLFVGAAAASCALDPLFQTAVLRHWGDNVLMLGGALIMVELSAGAPWQPALRAAAAASVFLVFGRHYGAFFSAALMGAGVAGLWLRDRRATWAAWPCWLALGGLLAVFSLREVNYILHPVPYYPGGKLLSLVGSGWTYHVVGAMHDWGLMTDGRPTPLGPRDLWLGALAMVPFILRRRGAVVPWGRLAAPLVVMALPLLLHALTGYRSTPTQNKPYMLGIFFMAWFPAFAVTLLPAGGPERIAARAVRWGGAAAAAVVAAWALVGPLAGAGPDRVLGWASSLYRSRNVDLAMAQALRDSGLDPAEVARRPLMYFYCEPGMGLRNYIGGTLSADLDFWGESVGALMPGARDLGEVVARAGWPNLYLSSTGTYGEFVGSEWQPFTAPLSTIEAQPWVERVVRAGNARLVIVRRPPG